MTLLASALWNLLDSLRRFHKGARSTKGDVITRKF
jgi:hypothetical protein